MSWWNDVGKYLFTGGPALAFTKSEPDKSRGGNVFDQYAGTSVNKVLDPLNLFGGEQRADMLDQASQQKEALAKQLRDQSTLTAPPGGQQTMPTTNVGSGGSGGYNYADNQFTKPQVGPTFSSPSLSQPTAAGTGSNSARLKQLIDKLRNMQ